MRQASAIGGWDGAYLFHVSLSHVNVSIHLLKVLLRSIRLFTVPLKSFFTLKKKTAGITTYMTFYRGRHDWYIYVIYILAFKQRSFYVRDTAMGSVKVCSLQIKQMFINAHLCTEKQPFIQPSSDPSNRTITVCWASVHSELCLSASHTMGSLNAQRSLRRTSELCMSLSAPPPPCRGQAEIGRGVLCNLSSRSST